MRSLLSYPAYTTDLVSGEGTFTADEWGHARQERDAYLREPSDASYMQALWRQFDQAAAAVALAKRFDFTTARTLGDIGGAPFFQAAVLASLHPHLRVLLTDYDGSSVQALSMVPLLSHATFATFDATRDDTAIFSDCDVLTMWGVDYALRDADIGRIVNLGKTLLLCADARASVFKGMATRAIHSAVGTKLRTLLRGPRKPVRQHGQFRTPTYMRDLIMSHGGRIADEWLVGHYRIYHVTSQ